MLNIQILFCLEYVIDYNYGTSDTFKQEGQAKEILNLDEVQSCPNYILQLFKPCMQEST
jgi:hypothetical protein